MKEVRLEARPGNGWRSAEMRLSGVHLALTQQNVAHLQLSDCDDEVLAQVEGLIEGSDAAHRAVSAGTWMAIHRVLTDGTLNLAAGEFPLNLCVLGGEQLYDGDEHLVALVGQAEVRELSYALGSIERDWFRERFLALGEDADEEPLDEAEFSETWQRFEDIRRLFARAVDEARSVLFSAPLG